MRGDSKIFVGLDQLGAQDLVGKRSRTSDAVTELSDPARRFVSEGHIHRYVRPVREVANDLANTRPVAVVERYDATGTRESGDIVGVNQNGVEDFSCIDVGEVELLTSESQRNGPRSFLEMPNGVTRTFQLPQSRVLDKARQALGDAAGCLVAPSDPAALARGIVARLQNDALRARKGELNRERIATQFSMEGMNHFFQEEIERGLGRSLGTL